MPRKLIILGVISVLILMATEELSAQQVTYDPNAEKFTLLSLNQAYINLGQAAKNFVRVKEQYGNKLVSTEEYEQALANYRNRKIDYDMALMRIMFNASYVIVERAVKRVEPDGTTSVTITVKNEAGGSFELSKIKTFGARNTAMIDPNVSVGTVTQGNVKLKEMLDTEALSYEDVINDTIPFIEGQGLAFADVINLLEINNIFISLSSRADTGESPYISKPYMKKIDKLTSNERAQVTFGLLRDTEICTVNISFGDKILEYPVYLELESGASGLGMTVSSDNPRLRADLEGTVSYTLTLQRYTEETSFALRAVNLPRQIDYRFIDPENNQPVETVNFIKGRREKAVQLELTMPKRTSELVQVDQSIPFQALVMNSEDVAKYDAMSKTDGRFVEEKEIATLNVTSIDLMVTPIGVGRIEVSASTFFYSIQPDEEVNMTLTIKNSGTGRLKDVEVNVDLPSPEWTEETEPKLIRSLDPEGEEKIEIMIAPPEEATVGEHIIKVKVEGRTSGTVSERVIEADDKDVTVEIKEKPDILGRLILIVLLIGIVLGIVIFGIKLSRR